MGTHDAATERSLPLVRADGPWPPIKTMGKWQVAEDAVLHLVFEEPSAGVTPCDDPQLVRDRRSIRAPMEDDEDVSLAGLLSAVGDNNRDWFVGAWRQESGEQEPAQRAHEGLERRASLEHAGRLDVDRLPIRNFEERLLEIRLVGNDYTRQRRARGWYQRCEKHRGRNGSRATAVAFRRASSADPYDCGRSVPDRQRQALPRSSITRTPPPHAVIATAMKTTTPRPPQTALIMMPTPTGANDIASPRAVRCDR